MQRDVTETRAREQKIEKLYKQKTQQYPEKKLENKKKYININLAKTLKQHLMRKRKKKYINKSKEQKRCKKTSKPQ